MTALASLLAIAPVAAEGGVFSLRFHGNGSGVEIAIDDPSTETPGPPADIGASDFTLEFWMKAFASENPAGPVTCGADDSWRQGHVIIDRDRFGQDRKFGVSVADGRIAFGVSGDGTGDLTLCGTVNVLNGEWHHIALERRRSDGFIGIFVDGALDSQANGPDGDVSYPDNGIPGDVGDPFLVIGAAKHDASGSLSYSGGIDELRLSTVLRYLANFVPSLVPFTPDTATVALYHFDEGEGDVAHDSSGADGGPSDGAFQVRLVNGEPVPPPVWSSDSPFPAEKFVRLTVDVVGSGSGSVISDDGVIDCGTTCSALLPSGTVVQLRRDATFDSAFEGWNPECEDGLVVLDTDTTCTASFRLAPDLVVPSFTAPASAAAGGTYDVTFTVRNQGRAAAGRSMLRIYLSPPGSSEPTLVEVGAADVGKLPVGTTSEPIAVEITLPKTLAPGGYNLFARADADHEVREGREGNNGRHRTIGIGPDLTISELTLKFLPPAIPAPGARVTIGDSIRNIGGDEAGASITRFYLSRSARLGSGEILLGSRSVGPLAAGATSTGEIDLTVPLQVLPGFYFLIAVVDARDQVGEIDEANNLRLTTVLIIERFPIE